MAYKSLVSKLRNLERDLDKAASYADDDGSYAESLIKRAKDNLRQVTGEIEREFRRLLKE